MIKTTLSPQAMVGPRRAITGISAMLLPFNEDGSIDWGGFCAHVAIHRDIVERIETIGASS